MATHGTTGFSHTQMGTIPAHAVQLACAVLGGSVMLLALRGDLFARGAVKYVLGYSRTFR
jgi:hypothetical protein